LVLALVLVLVLGSSSFKNEQDWKDPHRKIWKAHSTLRGLGEDAILLQLENSRIREMGRARRSVDRR
jgi:hypothetical protein